MDVARRSSNEFLTTADVAARGNFVLGSVTVCPPTRTVQGPRGGTDLEPRVIQVLLVLADSANQVVTRETLFNRCWGGVFVGDDSLNRAVAALRRALADIGAEDVEIETIPRTGYRLTGAIPKEVLEVRPDPRAVQPRAVSRRVLIGSSAAALAIAGGAGALLTIRSRSDARFDELIGIAESAIRTEDANQQIIRALEEATRIRPNSAKAWGLLAFFNAVLAQLSDPKDAAPLIDHAQDSAQRAFSIDRNEPNALLAMFELEGSTLDWFTRDQRLRRIISIDRANVWAIAELVLLLQAAGLNRESRNWNERAISLVPLSLDFLSKRALKLWLAGRVADADKVIDQVRALYPTIEWPWFVRFLIFAMTGRVQAAQIMFSSNPKMIADPPEARMWRTALPALAVPSADSIRRTREACFDAAKVAGQTRGQGVMILAALRDLDGAFAIADGALLGRGPIIRPEQPGSKAAVQDASDRINMQWMFTPPCASIRADPRFGPLCDGIGLTEYWRRRGVKPDYQLTER